MHESDDVSTFLVQAEEAEQGGVAKQPGAAPRTPSPDPSGQGRPRLGLKPEHLMVRLTPADLVTLFALMRLFIARRRRTAPTETRR